MVVVLVSKAIFYEEHVSDSWPELKSAAFKEAGVCGDVVRTKESQGCVEIYNRQLGSVRWLGRLGNMKDLGVS